MQDNFNIQSANPKKSIDECLLVKKIFGQCRQQDCLKPSSNLDSSDCSVDYITINSSILCSNYPLDNPASGPAPLWSTITPGETLRLVSGYTFKFKKDSFKISSIATSIEKGQFAQEGYWDITVKYKFSYILNIVDTHDNTIQVLSNGVLITDICACEIYEKKISLFGGESDCSEVVFADSLYGPEGAYSQNVPFVHVQAIANPLKFVTNTYSITCPSIPCVNQADLTIGLFTVIRLYRTVSLVVHSPGYCDVPLCDATKTCDPCETFNSLPFPFDQFNPNRQI